MLKYRINPNVFFIKHLGLLLVAGKVVLEINAVLLTWIGGQRRVPIGIKIWRKGRPSRVALAGNRIKFLLFFPFNF
jgi:hypothetical protein